MIFRHLLRARREAARLAAAKRDVGADEVTKLDWIRGQARSEFQQRKIMILGAGAAGLSCAYELSRLGFEVVVLEAEREHVGGRMRTHRTSVGGREIHAELGAMRIPHSHLLTKKYIHEFGLQTRKFVMTNEEAFLYLRRHAFKVGKVKSDEHLAMNLFDLTTFEREMGYAGLWEKAVVDVLRTMTTAQKAQLYADRLTDPQVIEFDHKALATALRDANLSYEASEYVMSMMGIETALPIALTEHLREENDEVWLGDFDELVDGTDALAKVFYSHLGNRVRRGCAVTRLEQPATSKARVIYRDPGGVLQTEEGDWLICTIPLGVLNRLDIRSAFGDRRLRAIQSVNYDASTKVIGRAPFRWWERQDGIYGGGTMYDTQLGSTWYPADNTGKDPDRTNAESLFLASYTWGLLARRIATVPDDQLDDVMLQELARVHPYIKDAPSLYKTEIRWAWDQIPTQSGAYAFFMPGEQYRFYQDMVGPDGRIFLTGEHVSHTHSWIQGALESAVETMHYIVRTEGGGR